MPYSLPIHSQGRPGHRRAYTTTGAFTPLPSLPHRTPTNNNNKKPTFHFRQDQDDDDDDDDSSDDKLVKTPYADDNDEDGRLHGLPPLRLKLNPNSSFNAVPFPRSSPPLRPPPRPSFSRAASTPAVLLSNGKPLKSSLKSSSSSPNIPFPAQSLVPSIMFPDLHQSKQQQQQQHQRASSAPCTPLTSFVSHPPSPPSTSTSRSHSPPSSHSHSPSSSFHHHHHTPKNVHFPSQEEGGLATIRLFNRSARPASLSRLGEETETETEGEGSSTAGNSLYPNGNWSGKYMRGSTFPFPRVDPTPSESPLNTCSTQQQQQQTPIPYQIDSSQSSVIPRKSVNLGFDNVFFESLKIVSGVDHSHSNTPLYLLQGTLLVRNITYQKMVMIRYTMDEWETVNDILGWYDVDKTSDIGWDRFKFSISLGDQKQLEGRIVWFVGKYVAGGGLLKTGGGVGAIAPVGAEGADDGAGEWWDNNEGKNYKVGFRRVEQEPVEEKEKPYKRGVVVSAPPTYTRPTATPTSTLTRPKLSAPQLSSSSSFPSSRFPGQQQYEERERERERERAQHQAALTQSTLARLKNLNLKNYAAPRGYGYGQLASAPTTPMPAVPTPVLTLTSASPTTSSFIDPPSPSSSSPESSDSTPPKVELPSVPNLRVNTTLEMSSPTLSTASTIGTDVASTDSTPIQTPTQDDDDEGHVDERYRKKIGGDDGEEENHDDHRSLGWGLGMESGHFATTVIPPAPRGGSIDYGSGMSTPTTIPIPGGGYAYPYASYPSGMMDVNTNDVGGGGATRSSGVVEMGTSPPFSDLQGSVGGVGRGGSVYWDWGSAGTAVLNEGGGGGEKEIRKESSWMNHHHHQSSSSLSSGVGGGLMPPQRRRGSQQQRGSGSSSSGSDSTNLPSAPSSGSSLSSPSLSPTQTPSSPSLSSSILSPPPPPPPAPPSRQKPTALKLSLPVPTLSMPGGVQSPYAGSARRDLGYYYQQQQQQQQQSSQHPSSQQQQPRYGHRRFQSMPVSPLLPPGAVVAANSPSTTPGSSSASSSNDAIYEALVREWCFAQGPAPIVSSSSTSIVASGETTPVQVVAGLGLGMGFGRLTSPLSEGE